MLRDGIHVVPSYWQVSAGRTNCFFTMGYEHASAFSAVPWHSAEETRMQPGEAAGRRGCGVSAVQSVISVWQVWGHKPYVRASGAQNRVYFLHEEVECEFLPLFVFFGWLAGLVFL